MKACKENDDKKIQACLTLGVDINSTDEDGYSGLWYAVYNKQLLDIFIKHPDLDIDQVNREQMLENAIPRGAEAVRKLCNLPGIDVNAGNPLKWAAFHNRKDIMKILAENPKLDWNNGDEIGYPITMALDSGCADIVEYLLQQPGLDLNVRLYRGRSVGQCAVEYSFLKEYSPHEKNVTRFPVKCVELLSKDSRVDWNIRNDEGETPIMVALKNKETEMVKILLRTPGVFLGDVAKTKEGDVLLKEILQEAEDQKKSLPSSVPECPVRF